MTSTMYLLRGPTSWRHPDHPSDQGHDGREQALEEADHGSCGLPARRQGQAERQGEHDDAERPALAHLGDDVLGDQLPENVHPRPAQAGLALALGLLDVAGDVLGPRVFGFGLAPQLHLLLGRQVAGPERGDQDRSDRDCDQHRHEVVQHRGRADDAELRRIADRGHPDHDADEHQRDDEQEEGPDENEVPHLLGPVEVGVLTHVAVENGLPEQGSCRQPDQDQDGQQVAVLHAHGSKGNRSGRAVQRQADRAQMERVSRPKSR
jgi:hypothetical protein